MRFFIVLFMASAVILTAFSKFYSIPAHMTPHPHVYPFDPLAEPRASRFGVMK